MANKKVTSITVNSENIRETLKERGLSLREAAKLVDRHERSFLRYLENGQMPLSVFDDLMRVFKSGVRKEPVDTAQDEKTVSINRKINELSALGLAPEQVMDELNKSLAAIHPNMFDDKFEIVREVRFV